MMREDKELKEFRDLMKAPDSYEEGFGWGTVLMALFVGLVMAPAQLYMGLVAGQGMGGAANWVTVILYVEVARRAFKKLRRPEIFVLFYMCGTVMGTGSSGLLWQQFLPQSVEMQKAGITEHIPSWYAPQDPAALTARNFLSGAWVVPIGLMFVTMLVSRLDSFGLGYVMYRLTSDAQELPFPMAPVGAMGMTALADASNQRETWRWRTFSVGAMAGCAFGAVYLALPTVTGAIFQERVEILPIPFTDLTSYTERALPAMPMMLSFDLGLIIAGMVIPFWAAVGGFIGLLITLVANPVLYRVGVLPGWEPGLGAIHTIQSNMMDFYLSFSAGLAFAIAVIGFYHVFTSLRKKRAEMGTAGLAGRIQWRRLFEPPAGRGDFPIWVAIGIYLFSTTTYIVLAYWLVNYASGPLLGAKFPLWILILYGFVYTPVISFVSAQMEGMVSMTVEIPYLREATFILSGYKGAAIWFAPIPMHNYGPQVNSFRTTELTGTKFTSLMKAEVLIFPILFVGTILFSQLIWSMGPVPSDMFPYATRMWELDAFNRATRWSGTLPEGTNQFRKAFKPEYIGAGLVLGLTAYAVLTHFGLPIFLIYGVVRGLDQTTPHAIVPMFIGALLGRFYFRKRFGDKWPQYRIVFYAGFGAGVGLAMMLGLGMVLVSKSVIRQWI